MEYKHACISCCLWWQVKLENGGVCCKLLLHCYSALFEGVRVCVCVNTSNVSFELQKLSLRKGVGCQDVVYSVCVGVHACLCVCVHVLQT